MTPKAIGTDKYEGAIAEGDSAVLLERLNDGLYCLNVGNLLPNDDVTISIQYAQVLNWQDRKLRFYFPCTIGDRYGHQRSANLHDYQQIEHTLDNGARLTFNLAINGELSSSLVTSPSHSLTVKREESSLILSGDRVIPDRDIIITLEALPSFTGEILVEKSAFGLQYCANLLLPSSDSHNESAQCFQFIVDRSGSCAEMPLSRCVRPSSQLKHFSSHQTGSTSSPLGLKHKVCFHLLFLPIVSILQNFMHTSTS